MAQIIALEEPKLIERALGRKISDWNNLSKRPRLHENAIQFFLLACGVLSIFTTIGILYVLLQESLSFFQRTLLDDPNQTLWTSLQEFFTHTVWQPAIGDFGILPLIYGTLSTSFIAMLVALPLGMGAAIYLSEYASSRTRNTIKPILEILAGVPTVVYGYFALTFMTPLLQGILGHDNVSIYNSTSAGIVVGILIIPLISSMSEDALSAVPSALRQASYGLGATKLETTVQVVIPAALSGILAAFIVAISRAIGETMVVAIAAGAGPQNNIPELLGSRGAGILLEPAETMTGHIARISGGDLSYNSIDYNSIFAIGMMLFIMTFILNMINNAIISRFREAY